MRNNDMRPQLRFPGFADAWVEKKLGDLGKIVTGSTPPTSNKEYYSDNGIPWVTPTDISSETISDTPRKLSDKGACVAHIVAANTILCTCIASIGKNALLTVEGSFNQQINGLTPYENNNAYFLLTESNFWSNKMKQTSAAGMIQIVNKTEFSELTTMTPSYEEQSLIGTFFSSLDRLIALNKHKLSAMKEYKKSMLQRMFPRTGSYVPELRFPGFSDAWVERRLGNYASYRKGAFPQPYGSDKWYGGKNAMPFIQVADVNDNMKLANTPKLFISQIAQSMSVLVPKNSVIVTLQGSIGRVAVTQYESYLDRTILYFEKYSEKTDIHFWSYVIKQKFEKEAQTAPGGIIKTITKEALSNFTLNIPSYEEQSLIGSFFSNLDRLISLQAQKLTQMELYKKALLQRMFC